MTSGEPPESDEEDRAEAAQASPVADGEAARIVRPTRPVIGLGASAGGLEALGKFLEVTPPDCGMAFVVVQHLDPDHESHLADLLSDRTMMGVSLASDGAQVMPNHVYVIPPRVLMTLEKGMLRLRPPADGVRSRMPIDAFFRSLAEDEREKAIGIVLSGTGTDGTLGLKAIKEMGGLVVVQDPFEAAQGGMPRSAIATGIADFVLPVAEIPDALIGYVGEHYFKAGAAPGIFGERAREALPAILDFLKKHSPVDFGLYKEGTLLRRIERRMGLNHIQAGPDYLDFLKNNPKEADGLCKDLLISVTSFFRDPEVFAYLETELLPALAAQRSADQPLRAWIAGCASGEEAYSLAMLLAERVEAAGVRRRIQIFASDVDEQVLAMARAGVYPESIEEEVSRARLMRFFVKEDHTYRVLPELREMVIFASHNLLSDAPFSNLDLILCRNVFIYIAPQVQKLILSLFHFALRQDGILVLGLSETVGDQVDLFEPASKKLRVYRRIGRVRPTHFEFPDSTTRRARGPGLAEPIPPRLPGNLAELTRKALVEHFAPAAVLINIRHEALYYSGDVDKVLKVSPGEANHDIIAMLRNGLRSKVRGAVAEAERTRAPVAVPHVFVRRGAETLQLTITVTPVDHEEARLFLVAFLEEPQPEAVQTGERASEPGMMKNFEQELEATRRELQTTIRDLERANEELKAANEEAMSMNEEFQSTNEELETSKEELQSLNEELTTVNNQLQEKIEEQRRTANDLENLLTSSDIATVFLDRALNIKRFTRSATLVFNLVATDIGRPFAEIRWKIDDPTLLVDAAEVLANLAPVRRDVRAMNGDWFSRRILPYRTQEGMINGVVITLVDVNDLKSAEHRERSARAFYESIVDTMREPLVVLDPGLHIVAVNRAYCTTFATAEDDAKGRSLFEVDGHRWDIPELRRLLEQVIPVGTVLNDYEVSGDFPGLGRRTMLLNARRVRVDDTVSDHILLAILDVTEREERREQLEERTARLTALLSVTPDAVINIDERGKIGSFSVGAEKMFGYSEREVVGQNVKMLMVEADRARHDGYIANYVRTGHKKVIGVGREVVGRRKDGSVLPMMLNITETVFDHVRIFTGVLRDLTDQKQTEDELRQARKMEVMGQLVGGVAHDFNNLLTVISGNLEILETRGGGENAADIIADAREAAKLAGALTAQMLSFARRGELHPTRLDVNALILNVAEMLRRIIDENVTVATALGEDVHPVLADEPSLRAALLNLAVNARDAMPDGGKLTITTENVARAPKEHEAQTSDPVPFVSICLTDTGLGMTPEVLQRATEPFFTTKEVGRGSGLGLSMVYGFARQSGGDLEIRSAPGKGTTVTILLPAAAPGEAPAASATDAPPPGTAAGGGERILLVEDDPRVRKVTVRRLQALGYRIAEADNGPAALALLARGEAFDLLFTDAVMPGGMSGIDLAREVRRAYPDLPVLFTSGYAAGELSLDKGDIVLSKPYGLEALARKIREALDR